MRGAGALEYNLQEILIPGERIKFPGQCLFAHDSFEQSIKRWMQALYFSEIFNITRGEGRTLLEYVEMLRHYFPDLHTEIKPIQWSLYSTCHSNALAHSLFC